VHNVVGGDVSDSALLSDRSHTGKEFSEQERQKRRPQLLFLAHHFPPVNSVACVRTWNIAKYLSRLGWEVRVVTPDPSLWRFTDSPVEVEENLKKEGIQRVATGHNWRWLNPGYFKCWDSGLGWVLGGICRTLARKFNISMEIGWFKACTWACKSLTEDQVDIILVSGPPFISFELAKYFSEMLGKPYVLDYRDPWSGNPHHRSPFIQSHMQLEATLLKDCAAALIVSPSWAGALRQQFPVKSKLHVITNGFDPDEFIEVKPMQFDHFAIVYCGNFYPPKRVITPVMAALQQLKDLLDTQELPQWTFHYFGRHGSHVDEEARKFNVSDRVILHGRVSRSEALSAVKGAGVSVVITSVAEEVDAGDKGIIPGKIFEAMGLKTPILLIAPSESDIRKIVGDSGVGACFTGNNIEGIVSFLIKTMNEVRLESENLEAYAWPNISKRLSGVLKDVLSQASYYSK